MKKTFNRRQNIIFNFFLIKIGICLLLFGIGINTQGQDLDLDTKNAPILLLNDGYSRAFDHRLHSQGGDYLNNFSVASASKMCKASFSRKRITNLLRDSPDNYWVKITIEPNWMGLDKKNFIMSLYNAEGGFIDYRMANFPCPEDCVPPETIMALSLDDVQDNTFDVGDIRDVLEVDEITYVNVHSSLRHGASNIVWTHTIYALTRTITNAIPHYGVNDPVFTSIVHKPE